jgi:hypothetical protein
MLAKIYTFFTEGFDTKDLQEAKVLLDSLQRFSFEQEDRPVSADRDKAAGRSRRERPWRKRSAYSDLPSCHIR